jgi:hypothetical protein
MEITCSMVSVTVTIWVFSILKEAECHFIYVTVYLCVQCSQREEVPHYFCDCLPVCSLFSKSQESTLLPRLCTCVFSILKDTVYHFIAVTVYLCVQYSQTHKVSLYCCDCVPVCSPFSKTQVLLYYCDCVPVCSVFSKTQVPLYCCNCGPVCSVFSKTQGTTLFQHSQKRQGSAFFCY